MTAARHRPVNARGRPMIGRLSGGGLRLWRNGRPQVALHDAALARAYPGIWLDPERPLAPALRAALLSGD